MKKNSLTNEQKRIIDIIEISRNYYLIFEKDFLKYKLREENSYLNEKQYIIHKKKKRYIKPEISKSLCEIIKDIEDKYYKNHPEDNPLRNILEFCYNILPEDCKGELFVKVLIGFAFLKINVEIYNYFMNEYGYKMNFVKMRDIIGVTFNFTNNIETTCKNGIIGNNDWINFYNHFKTKFFEILREVCMKKSFNDPYFSLEQFNISNLLSIMEGN